MCIRDSFQRGLVHLGGILHLSAQTSDARLDLDDVPCATQAGEDLLGFAAHSYSSQELSLIHI